MIKMRYYGNGTPAFITENEDGYTNSPEFVAALYESWHADQDLDSNPDESSADSYARTAHRLSEEIEGSDYDRTCPYCYRLQEDIEAHQFGCEPMDRY